MKTSELVEVLSATVEPVDQTKVTRALVIAFALSGLSAFAGVLVVLGVRTDFRDWMDVSYLMTKLVFASGVLLSATIFLLKFARPGGERYRLMPWLALPFATIAALAGWTLLVSHTSAWPGMIMGHQIWTCLVSIPVFAAIPFLLMVWALRAGAPTDLNRAGALAGLAAGGFSAAAYAVHCADDSLPFIAVWYGVTIALCTFAGAKLGPRLLRW